jgi:hypothetical protein
MPQKKGLVEKFSQHNISIEFIPPRLNNLLQPADVFVSLKDAYRQERTNWFIFDDKAFTRYGNLRNPGYPRLCLPNISYRPVY